MADRFATATAVYLSARPVSNGRLKAKFSPALARLYSTTPPPCPGQHPREAGAEEKQCRRFGDRGGGRLDGQHPVGNHRPRARLEDSEGHLPGRERGEERLGDS